MDSSSLVNLGDITKPATVLVEKISDAVGGIFKPHQMRRVAKAEADIALIQAQNEIEITALHQRGLLRWVEEIAEQQFNMEEITSKALPLVGEDASPQFMHKDWITNFFSKCRGISDSGMQELWARILAGEANRSGSFSRKTVNVLEDLGKEEAILFSWLCGFVWKVHTAHCPVVFNSNDEIYQQNRINFLSLTNLETLGLIHYSSTNVSNTDLPERVVFHYFGRPLELLVSGNSHRRLSVGKVVFTQAGEELSSICNSGPVAGFYDYACNKWEAEKNVVSVNRLPEPISPQQ